MGNAIYTLKYDIQVVCRMKHQDRVLSTISKKAEKEQIVLPHTMFIEWQIVDPQSMEAKNGYDRTLDRLVYVRDEINNG